MLDIKYIRENPEIVKKAITSKNTTINIDELLFLDSKKRELQYQFDVKKAHQNKISKEIGKLKGSGQDAAAIVNEMQTIAAEIKSINTDLAELTAKMEALLITIPNIPHSSVPIGFDEKGNAVIKEYGVESKKTTAIEHQLIAEELGMLNLARGAKITGSGFPIYRGKGALLERALISFMLDFHREHHHYEEVAVPFVVNRKAMLGTGQLPKLENDMYHIDEDDLFLIPTGEVPVTNIFADEILSYKDLPCKLVTYTPCFRREAGSYGKDTKGLQRIHQFNKVELVRFVVPEKSYDALEEMVREAESILEALELPYRRVLLCSGDMSFASAKTYDLEVWAPGVRKYLEVSSLSNFEDFQARRASIRYRDEKGKVGYLHTLNGSGLATPRTYIAIIENYQNDDGSITVPQVLRKYLNGLEVIRKE